MADTAASACSRYGIINCKKMQTLIISKNHVGNLQFTANNVALTMAETATYLSCTLNKYCLGPLSRNKMPNRKARGTFNKIFATHPSIS